MGENSIVVKIEEDEHAKVNKKSVYFGVTFDGNISKWKAQRRSKSENKTLSNGHYDDEKTAARASDTLAKTLMKNGEQNHKLNFPEDHTEVYPEKKKTSSKFIGVSFEKKWRIQRWSKSENKMFYNGRYDDEETAARASDTLARKLMKNGEQTLKLNFPEDDTENYPEEKKTSSKFIGVSLNKKQSYWETHRRSKSENKTLSNGHFDDEETAACASDTLARNLMKNGEQNHKLNFPEDDTEVYPEKKKTSSKFIGVSFNKKQANWRVERWNKSENKLIYNGYYDNEETAARASDTLA